jgi:hypothetical protein
MTKRDTRFIRQHRPNATIGEISPIPPIAEQSPPDREIVSPQPNRPRARKRPTFLPETLSGDDVRIEKDGDTWRVSVNRPLTAGESFAMNYRGFEDVSEKRDGSLWEASQWKLVEHADDLSGVAGPLAREPEGWGR